MIKYKTGNVLKVGTEDVIVHGCNCFHSFGAGIANQIAGLYPEAYVADMSYKPKGDKSKLGEYSQWTGQCRGNFDGKITIVNMYTQYTFTRDAVDLDYGALLDGMTILNSAFWDQTISMPMIGCGLAGGDWDRVVEILDRVFGPREIVVYKL